MSQKEVQEVDIFEVVQLMFKGIFKLFISSFNFLSRNIVKLIIFTVLGAVVGLGVYHFHENHYQSEIIYKSNSLPANHFVNTFNNLNWKELIAHNGNVKNIYCTYVLDINHDDNWDIVEYNEKANQVTDTKIINQRSNDYFAIVVELYDNTDQEVLRNVKQQIEATINNDQTALEKYNMNVLNNKSLLKQIDFEIVNLNKRSSQDYDKQTSEANKTTNVNVLIHDERTSYKDVIELLDLKHEIEYKLKTDTQVCTVDQDFTKPIKTKSLMKTLFLYIIIAFFIGVVYSISIEIKENL